MMKRACALPAALALMVACAASAADGAAWCTAQAQASVVKSLTASAGKLLPGSPRAIPRIHVEGTLPHQGIWDISIEAKKDLHLMRDLAMLWRANGDKATLARLASLMDTWAGIYKPAYNPIDETDFDMLVDAYAIARAALPSATREKVGAMLRGWGDGYVREMANPGRGGHIIWVNNWQSHRIKLATLMAVALEDREMFAAARGEFRKQLGQNLRADGRTMDFEERDALHYTVYDLEPLVRAAMAAKLRGEDWLNLRGDNGATVAKALDWLLPYANGDKVHEEYVNTNVKFDHQRRDAGLPGYTGLWDPENSRELYWLAATLDPKYRPIAQKLGPRPVWLQACLD